MKLCGYLFVATPEELAAMDVLVGPTRPMMPGKRGGRRIPLLESSIAHRYSPSFFDEIIHAILKNAASARLEAVNEDQGRMLYRFPASATDFLAELTPDKPDFTKKTVESITERVMEQPWIREQYKPGGVSSAVLIVRGEALKAIPRGSGKEMFWWCWQRR